jgi:hypothetical protein
MVAMGDIDQWVEEMQKGEFCPLTARFSEEKKRTLFAENRGGERRAKG